MEPPPLTSAPPSDVSRVLSSIFTSQLEDDSHPPYSRLLVFSVPVFTDGESV